MLPIFTRSCCHPECSLFQIAIVLNEALSQGDEAAQYQQLLMHSEPSECSTCHRFAPTQVRWVDKEFTSLEGFHSFMSRLMGMASPLKKLIAHGVADSEDMQRWEAVRKYLKGGYCRCCMYPTDSLASAALQALNRQKNKKE